MNRERGTGDLAGDSAATEPIKVELSPDPMLVVDQITASAATVDDNPSRSAEKAP